MLYCKNYNHCKTNLLSWYLTLEGIVEPVIHEAISTKKYLAKRKNKNKNKKQKQKQESCFTFFVAYGNGDL